jgi:hypothetical protein
MMPNYKRSIIYKLTSFDNLVYYGASTGPLKTRYTRHKLSAIRKLGYESEPLFKYRCSPPVCVVVENYECNSKEELTERLDYYIDHNICVNKRNPKKRKKVGITQARQIVKIYNQNHRYGKQRDFERQAKVLRNIEYP